MGFVNSRAEEDELEPAAAVRDGDFETLALAPGALLDAKECRRASATWATTVTCSSIGSSARCVSWPRSSYLRG